MSPNAHDSPAVTATVNSSTNASRAQFAHASWSLLAATALAVSACAPAPHRNAEHGASAARQRADTSSNARQVNQHDDSAFTAMQTRGADMRAMGVDQQTSVHHFEALADGGRIELQRGVDDSAGVAQIRRHLHAIAAAFATGDFSTPAFVHMQAVPGTIEMAAHRSHITYAVSDLPRGGDVRMTTRDTTALRAIHEFLAFQRQEHHVGGGGSMAKMH